MFPSRASTMPEAATTVWRLTNPEGELCHCKGVSANVKNQELTGFDTRCSLLLFCTAANSSHITAGSSGQFACSSSRRMPFSLNLFVPEVGGTYKSSCQHTRHFRNFSSKERHCSD